VTVFRCAGNVGTIHLVVVFGLLLSLLVIIGESLLAGWLASRKGRPFWFFFVMTLFLGPLMLLIAVLVRRRDE